MHQLIRRWNEYEHTDPPYLLDGDASLLEDKRLYESFHSWESFVASESFGERTTAFQLGLVPKPFLGNLESASVVLLMLNPGFGPHDYFAEHNVPTFRDRMIANLAGGADSFPFLDPALSWHMGYAYWEPRLREVIEQLGKARDLDRRSAQSYLASRLAVLQLAPYHSVSFGLPPRLVRSMESISLARQYVHEQLLPRANAGKCLIVCARQARTWQLQPGDNVVVYGAGAARSASLGLRSKGGAAIVRHLLRHA